MKMEKIVDKNELPNTLEVQLRNTREGEHHMASQSPQNGGSPTEEYEEDDIFTSLAGFTADFLSALSIPVEPLNADQKQPRPLSTEGHNLPYTVKLIQDLITYDMDEPDITYRPEPLDNVGQLVATSHMLAALVTTLEPRHLRRLATRLVSDASLWISRLFRNFDSTAFLHEDAREGIIRVCRMVLYHKYPNFASNGLGAILEKPPIIYTSTSVRPGLPQHIASQFGFGNSCIRIVPCNTMVGSPVAMDTASLDRLMEEDLNAQRKPLLVIANAGGGLVGGVDNLSRIQELCLKYGAWLHVEGHAIAALTLPNAPNLPAKIGDSMTIPLSTWLGIPSLPYVTLYHPCGGAAVYASGLTSLSLHVRLSSLPLWMAFQTLGQNGITSRLRHAFEISQYMQKKLIDLDHVRMLSSHPKFNEGFPSIKELVTRPISTSQLLETACGTIVFQYVEDKNKLAKNSEYFDSLNSWLGQVIRRDVNIIPLELMHLESAGLAIRWSSLEAGMTQQTSLENVDQFIECLTHQIEILNATVIQKIKFTEYVNSETKLQLAEIPLWAGLGGVRYIPEIYASSHEEFSDAAKLEISRLNDHLVGALRDTDSAFSLGEDGDGFNCIRFGMVTSDTNIKELLELVLVTGKDIETSAKFINQMTEVVKKGIETATADLQRENEERLWQEGILRHVPLVSSVYNWLSPPPAPGIRGRTLDLAAGVIESTENTYRYHMQVKHGQNASRPETKLPPTPSVVKPVTPTPPSSSHSRESSASASANASATAFATVSASATPALRSTQEMDSKGEASASQNASPDSLCEAKAEATHCDAARSSPNQVTS